MGRLSWRMPQEVRVLQKALAHLDTRTEVRGTSFICHAVNTADHGNMSYLPYGASAHICDFLRDEIQTHPDATEIERGRPRPAGSGTLFKACAGNLQRQRHAYVHKVLIPHFAPWWAWAYYAIKGRWMARQIMKGNYDA